MTTSAAWVLGCGLVVVVIVVVAAVWYAHRAGQRAKAAETEAAAERARKLELEVRETREQARTEAGRMSGEELLAEIQRIAERARGGR